MKKQILKYSLIFFSLLFSFLAWQSVDRAIRTSSGWGVPIVWFSLFFVLLSLSMVMIRRRIILELEIFLSLIFSFVFARSLFQLIFIALGFLLVSWACERIVRDMRLNIKLDLWKTIRMGSTLIVLGVGLVISSQYYFEIKDASVDKILPKVDMSGISDALIQKMLATANPNFKNIDNSGLTVDELVLEAQAAQSGGSNGADQAVPLSTDQVNQMIDQQFGSNISNQERQTIIQEYQNKMKDAAAAEQKIVLDDGRQQISNIVGMPLTGNEKVADVISQFINNKIGEYFSPGADSNMPLLPLIMALVLFLSVISLGSFLDIFWVLVCKFIFFIFVRLKLVEIKKVQAEVEVID